MIRFFVIIEKILRFRFISLFHAREIPLQKVASSLPWQEEIHLFMPLKESLNMFFSHAEFSTCFH